MTQLSTSLGLDKTVVELIFQNIAEKFFANLFVDSGSRAEGFDFQSSDFDIMCVLKDVNVIQRAIQENMSESSMILSMETGNTRPGFVRLKALYYPLQCSGIIGLRKLGQEYYMSSNKLVELLSSVNNRNGVSFRPHGPCISSTIEATDLDLAITLSSETWPMEAVGCVQRLLRRRWPSDDVITNMVSDGCLFVPVGCKMSPDADVEWRMSFSLAEERLVRFMNHTQFLTYGLLKLFLKEVVEENDETRGFLCSYFMKTLVFWEIIESDIPWTPSCLLQNVWNCFRRLLSWISNGYCPNFFIPENNMFCGKIHGRDKQTLLSF
ncbi:hypothetical protein FSP39_003168 [Pinctada imbricata]|uniref:Mab-21-like nucleotidyltransferase domain-containing protein n=1 Tax=Pinctada imbricata TaxID=66713 RepID=A0AA89C0L7_PINIB|nr:hypothetical protein FSP39_003168 [Pinctada imbricata]